MPAAGSTTSAGMPTGLVPAIAQDAATGKVLTLAWMNRDALAHTESTRTAHYWSRSRRKLWQKGETSGIRAASARDPHRL